MKAHIREMIIVNLETRLVKREKNVKRDSKGHKEGHRISKLQERLVKRHWVRITGRISWKAWKAGVMVIGEWNAYVLRLQMVLLRRVVEAGIVEMQEGEMLKS